MPDVLDYRNAKAADPWLPRPAVLSSPGWRDLHLEIFQQPKFEIAEHQHTMHVIAYAPAAPTASTGERWLAGKMRPEVHRPGGIAIVPAAVAHRCNWNTAVEFMILALEPSLLRQIGQDVVDGDRIELIPRFMTQTDPLIQGIFLTLEAELGSSQIGSDLLVDSLKTTLAIHLLRHYCTTQPRLSHSSNGLSELKLHQIREYINEHLNQDLRLVELSAIAQLSPYYFLRLFKQRTGITPHQYILQQRLERAKDLLQHRQLSLVAIAMRTGFADQSHLTKCFKRRFGMTPKQFLQN
jgi:AraC family transcriptional regulator